eukprot:1717750-Prymnesium_polylepis.1
MNLTTIWPAWCPADADPCLRSRRAVFFGGKQAGDAVRTGRQQEPPRTCFCINAGASGRIGGSTGLDAVCHHCVHWLEPARDVNGPDPD